MEGEEQNAWTVDSVQLSPRDWLPGQRPGLIRAFPLSGASQPEYFGHLGLTPLLEVGCCPKHGSMFSSTPGVHPRDACGDICPLCQGLPAASLNSDNQKCLLTLPDVPQGAPT